MGNFKIKKNLSILNNSRRRYIAEILPIRRKTLSNQSEVFKLDLKCEY